MVDICDKNGEIEYATLLFKQMVEPNIYLYNVMIRAYTHSHLYISTIYVYKQMLRDGDPQGKYPIFPGKFTYPFVIKSCGGLLCLDLGKQVHGHGCKFGRKSNTVIENSLLDMYIRTHSNLEVAVIAMEQLLELEPDDVGNYVLLSNIYAKLGRWNGVSRIRKLMRKGIYWILELLALHQSGYGDVLETLPEDASQST
ncbi:hypothetical protein RHMOL_Rhmol07G0183900 [Rhododendron molle]|uniref:Uncharacterized protein n=1 Tax=Rhododendron molle TaxID=49168 RepID=A0ACC0N1V1_RHOML|nr:hypothetical protein RHMOL_Rhmol07G0183900 [Rhododendron molle]